MALDLITNSFNAGVWSPLLDGRSDLEKFYSACRLLDNMIATRYGPAERRPGLYYVAEVKDSSKKTRLLPFKYSTVQAYILEAGDQYIRFYKDRGQIVYTDISFGANPSGDFAVGATMTGANSGATAIVVAKVSTQVYTIKYEQGTWTDGEVINCGDKNVDCADNYPTTAVSSTPVEISSPYLEADLFGLQRIQSADVMYSFHSNYNPRKLMRYAHDNWEIESIDFNWPPFMDENDGDITITTVTPSDITSGQTYSQSGYQAGWPGSEAFDDIITGGNGWRTECDGIVNSWVSVQFGAGKTVTKIRVQPCRNLGEAHEGPRHCKLEGSDNGIDWTKVPANKWVKHCSQYNTDEIEIDDIANYTDWAEIEFTNETAYTYYRLFCYDNWGYPHYLGIKEIEMFESLNTYTASAPIFTSDHVGSYWLIKHPRTAYEATAPNKVGSAETDGFFNAAGEVTETLKDVEGSWNFRTAGTWTGEIVIERSYDEGATWHTLTTVTSEGDQNFNVPETEKLGDAWLRAKAVDPPGTLVWANEAIPTLTVERYYHYGIIKITAVASPISATATVIRTLGSTNATKLWSEGAWSDERGYPSCGTFHEERLMVGGTTYQPHGIRGSKTFNWENFRTGTLDDHSVSYTLAANEMNAVRWLISKEVLLLGTAGAEWKLGSFDADEPLTPGNPIKPRIQTTYGSKDIQAIMLANVVLFVQQEGRVVRGAQYVFEKGESGGYDAPDYTTLAEHITKSGIVGMVYQQQPEPILWAWLDNGTAIGMTFEPGQKIWGWFPLTTDGDIESMGVIPGVSEDEVWCIVKREINGNTKRYIEYMKPRDWGDDQKDCFFVDSGLTFDGGDAVTITGITKANPCVVTAVAHGKSDGDQVRIRYVGGMSEVRNRVFTVSNPDTDTIELRDKLDTVDIDSTAFTAFVSSISGDTTYGSTDIKNVSAADIAAMALGAPITAVGVPTGATVTAIYDNWFTISDEATVTDTAVTITIGGTVEQVDNTFAGLDHLEAKTVSVLGDGTVHDNVVVSSGAVTLTDYFNKVHIGLPYKSKLKPMKLEAQTQSGTARAKIKRIHSIIFSFYKSLGCTFGIDEGTETIPFRKTTDAMGEAVPLFTGEKEMGFPGGYELSGDIYVEQKQPLPLTVRSITPRLQLYD